MIDSHLVGNEFLKKRLFSKNVKHSNQPILIYGEKGLGKFLAAKLYSARYLMGEDKYRNTEDFLKEKETVLALSQKHPDQVIIDARSGAVKIKELREMISHSHIKPNQADNNVIIIRDCDELSIQSQNTLLKILEDPPENTVLILTATSSYSLLETIRSRVRMVFMEPVSDEEAKQYLKNKFDDISESKIIEAVSFFPGNIGKMIAFLEDEESGTEREHQLIMMKLVESIVSRDMYSLLILLDEVKKDRQTFTRVSKELEELYSHALLKGEDKKNDLSLLIEENLSINEIYRGLKCIEETLNRSVWNPNLSVNSLKLAWGLIYIENEE